MEGSTAEGDVLQNDSFDATGKESDGVMAPDAAHPVRAVLFGGTGDGGRRHAGGEEGAQTLREPCPQDVWRSYRRALSVRASRSETSTESTQGEEWRPAVPRPRAKPRTAPCPPRPAGPGRWMPGEGRAAPPPGKNGAGEAKTRHFNPSSAAAHPPPSNRYTLPFHPSLSTRHTLPSLTLHLSHAAPPHLTLHPSHAAPPPLTLHLSHAAPSPSPSNLYPPSIHTLPQLSIQPSFLPQRSFPIPFFPSAITLPARLPVMALPPNIEVKSL
ncbi:vegetative cell wall protein gp1-like [Portunus trituberculatus]|uniref:vegetative cell wall protein gp1-like n=1 Tax=Portunus trituberculatus TaxID=210409 RepID=UPI001E1CB91E|nr:vegetative cell wall protein gp1-like [Portunus trituberculatus]